jgi:hypothetical protein
MPHAMSYADRYAIEQLAAIALKGLPSSTPSTQALYNPGGLFATPTLSDAVISAVSLPSNTLATRLH